MYAPPPLARAGRIRRALRLLGWNALLLLVGVMLVAIAGEACLRLTMYSPRPDRPLQFVPNVGLLWPPNTEIHHTNKIDWNAPTTNSLGFLDREPPNPERAAATCHVSMIGDSFVEAKQVPIHDKFHVRLEKLAADELPHLNVTTSAFGIQDTGQVQQLPFYDQYARLLHPKLLVLVFVHNDFMNNTPSLRALKKLKGDRRNFLEPTVRKSPDGKLELAWSRPRDLLPSIPQPSWTARARKEATEHSLLARWLRDRKRALFPADHGPSEFQQGLEALGRKPGYAALLEGWRFANLQDMVRSFARKNPPPLFEDALQYTHFALEQFQQRADQDDAKLVILASSSLKTRGTHMFERLNQMAASLDIPVIDQTDYILRQNARPGDARWLHDFHWNPTGHQWAAESLLEYIEKHPAICNKPT